MRKVICIFLSSLLLVVCLSGCETYNINRGNRNALVIKPAKQSMVDAKLLSKKGTMIISIGSAFMGGGIPDIKEGSAQYSHFYREKYPQGYNLGEAEPLAWIDGFFHNGVEYTILFDPANVPGGSIRAVKNGKVLYDRPFSREVQKQRAIDYLK